MEKKDEDLMLDYIQGDTEALTTIFHRYKKPLLNYALRILGNRADAEDVLSEVFMVIFSKKYQYNPNAKFSTWAYTVTRNMCISRLRQKKNILSLWFRNEETDEMEPWEIADSKDLPPEDLQRAETIQHIRNAIQKLPLPQREALVLREYQHLNYEEISKILHCSLENVKILIFRARQNLSKTIPSFIKEENHG